MVLACAALGVHMLRRRTHMMASSTRIDFMVEISIISRAVWMNNTTLVKSQSGYKQWEILSSLRPIGAKDMVISWKLTSGAF